MYCYCVDLYQWSDLNNTITLPGKEHVKYISFLLNAHISFLGNTTLMFYLGTQPPSFTTVCQSGHIAFSCLPFIKEMKSVHWLSFWEFASWVEEPKDEIR